MSDFKNELKQEVDFINDIISRYLPEETGLDKKIRESMNYSVNAGGKRVRPMLMLEVYKLCGGNDCQVVYPFMAALECIHSYSLVHDDLPAMIMMITEEEDLQHIRYSEKILEYLQETDFLILLMRLWLMRLYQVKVILKQKPKQWRLLQEKQE